MIRTIIVENDPYDFVYTRNLLRECKEPIEVLCICTNIDDACASINKFKPELVLLDIVLDNGETGFQLLERFNRLEFAVIFTTRFSDTNNAISAIRACALDFLPKPISITELNHAVDKFVENKKQAEEQLRTLKANVASENSQIKEIWISDTEGKYRIEVANIIYCRSDNYTTTFFVSEPIGQRVSLISSDSIKNWEQQLFNSPVCRIHRSYLLNLNFVEKYQPLWGGAEVTLKNGMTLPVSKSRKDNLKQRLRFFKR
jgi:two-component system, LytTR family, response regulator